MRFRWRRTPRPARCRSRGRGRRGTDRGSFRPAGRCRNASGSARVRLSHPLFSGPQPRAPLFDFRPHFCHSAPMETHAFGSRVRANAPEGQKRFSISARSRQKIRTSAANPWPRGPSPAEKACEAAACTSKALRAAPDNDMLLAVYSLYKHGGTGDATGAHPGMMDVLGRANSMPGPRAKAWRPSKPRPTA
jgi:acyl-CoA-binding protein